MEFVIECGVSVLMRRRSIGIEQTSKVWNRNAPLTHSAISGCAWAGQRIVSVPSSSSAAAATAAVATTMTTAADEQRINGQTVYRIGNAYGDDTDEFSITFNTLRVNRRPKIYCVRPFWTLRVNVLLLRIVRSLEKRIHKTKSERILYRV